MTKLEQDTRLIAEYDGWYSIRNCGHILLYNFGLEGFRANSIGKYERIPYYHNSDKDLMDVIFTFKDNKNNWYTFMGYLKEELNLENINDEYLKIRNIMFCSIEKKFNAVVKTIKSISND